MAPPCEARIWCCAAQVVRVLTCQFVCFWAALDFIAAGVFLTALAIETTADYQMFAFQTIKYHHLGAGKQLHQLPPRYRSGFVYDGLFAHSRHPSYACEVTMWVRAMVAVGQWLYATPLTGRRAADLLLPLQHLRMRHVVEFLRDWTHAVVQHLHGQLPAHRGYLYAEVPRVP